MNELDLFKNTEVNFQKGCIDIFEKDNKLFFRLSDIAKILEVGKNTSSMWKDWADEDEIEFKKNELGGHSIPYCSESLLYRILNRSNSPKARPFERWVTKEVLPSVRQNGGYIANQENLSDDELMAKALITAQKIIANKEKMISEMKPKAEVYDDFLSRDKFCNFRDGAAYLGISQTEFMDILKSKYIYKNNIGEYRAYAEYTDYFTLRPFARGTERTGQQLMLNLQGLEYFGKLLKMEIA